MSIVYRIVKGSPLTFEEGDGNIEHLDTHKIEKPNAPTTGHLLKWNGTAWVSSAITKNDVGLGNVDNTSDVNKPISTATQTALDNKEPKATNSPSNGDVLSFSGGNRVWAPASGGGTQGFDDVLAEDGTLTDERTIDHAGKALIFALNGGKLTIQDGNQLNGKVWTCNDNGDGNWQAPSTPGLDAVIAEDGVLTDDRQVTIGHNELIFDADAGIFGIRHDGSGAIVFKDGTQEAGKVWTDAGDGAGTWIYPEVMGEDDNGLVIDVDNKMLKLNKAPISVMTQISAPQSYNHVKTLDSNIGLVIRGAHDGDILNLLVIGDATNVYDITLVDDQSRTIYFSDGGPLGGTPGVVPLTQTPGAIDMVVMRVGAGAVMCNVIKDYQA